MRVRTIRLPALGLLVALFLGLAAPAQAQTTLRYKFKEMEKLNYELVQKMTMKLDIAGKELEMVIAQNIDMLWHIKSVDTAGKAKMMQKFERFRLTMDTPMGKVEFDSKDGKIPDGPFGQALAPLAKVMGGLEVGLSMDAMGEISEVMIPEKVLDVLKKGGGAAAFGDMFTPDGLKKMLSQSGLVLPKGAVAKGGKGWNQKISSKLPFGEMKIDNGYTYQGQVAKGDQKLEQIAIKMAINLDADPGAALEIKLKDGTGKGTAYFDNATGRLLEINSTQNMTMEALGQSMKMIQTVVLKLKPPQ